MTETSHAISFSARALRLILGAGALVVAWLMISATFGGNSASAEESTPDEGSVLGSLSSSVSPEALGDSLPVAPGDVLRDATALVPSVVDAADAAASGTRPAAVDPSSGQSVVNVLPPVISEVADGPVANVPVMDAVVAVANSVATPLDSLIDEVPVVSAIVGETPVRNLIDPVSNVLDDANGALGELTSPVTFHGDLLLGAVAIPDEIGPPLSPTPELEAAPTGLAGTPASNGFDRADSALNDAATPPPSTVPVAQPDGDAPPGPRPSLTSGAPASGSAGGSSAVGELIDAAWLFSVLPGGAAQAHDDTLVHPPTFDSDSTPD